MVMHATERSGEHGGDEGDVLTPIKPGHVSMQQSQDLNNVTGHSFAHSGYGRLPLVGAYCGVCAVCKPGASGANTNNGFAVHYGRSCLLIVTNQRMHVSVCCNWSGAACPTYERGSLPRPNC